MNSKRIATISTIALLLNSSPETASAVSLTAHSDLVQAPVEAAAKSNVAATATVGAAAATQANTQEQRKDKTEKDQDKPQ